MSTARPLRLLILEDQPVDAELVLDELRQSGFELEWTLVDNEADYLAQLDPALDIIISDYSLPQWDAPSALRALQDRGMDIPFIMISGTVGEEQAVECMRQGAADYLLKDRLARLGQAVTRVLEDQRLKLENLQAQAAQRESELRYRRLFEAARDGILILDAETGQIVDVNPFLVDLLGYSYQDLLAKKVWEIGPFTTLIASQDAFWELVETGYARSSGVPLETGAGSTIAVEFVSNVYRVDKTNVIQCNIRDITERKRAQEAIAFQAKLLDTVAEAVIATDLDGTITYWNHFAETLYGWSAEEAIGGNIVDLTPTHESREQAAEILARLQAGESWSGEFTVQNRAGAAFPALVMDTPIFDETDAQIGMIGVSIDISERKQAELRLAKLNRTLAVLSDVNQAIVRIRLPSELFDKVCRIAVDLGGFRMAWVGLFDPETKRVNPVASAGATEDYLEKLNVVVDDSPRGHGPTAIVMRTGKAIIVNDVEHDPRVAPWRADALRLGYRASAGFPLLVGDETRGVLNLYANQPDFFDEREIQLLDEMAADISFAIEFSEQEALRLKAETELKQHMQAVEEMHLFLQTTLDAFPAHTAVLDPDGTIINANAAWKQFAVENGSQSPSYYLGTNYLTVCDTAVGARAEEAPAVAAGIRTVINGTRDDFYLEYACHSLAEKRWFMLRVTPFPEPAPRRVVVAHVDVTERRLAEEAIRELNADLEVRVMERTTQYAVAKERVEAILNSSSDAIILCRMDGTIIQANRASEMLLGSKVDGEFDRRLSRLAIPDHRANEEEAFQAVLESKQPQRLDITIQRGDGSTYDADMVLSPVLSEEGSLSGVVCVLHDITERKRMQDDLRIALEKERELGELKTCFVSIVSHEFRNPLASILSAADLMTNYGDRMTDERKGQHLDAIQQQVQHLTELMNDILLIGKTENVGFAFSPAPLDLTGFCQSCITQVRQTAGASHRLRLAVEGECGDTFVDEKLLRHILMNLLTNAVKYSPAESTVYVNLRCEPEQAILSVRDEGIGIPAEDQPHLFEAFHRAANVGPVAGTGLGLAITKRAVEAHKGTIDFESAAGQGTTFIVTFPIR